MTTNPTLDEATLKRSKQHIASVSSWGSEGNTTGIPLGAHKALFLIGEILKTGDQALHQGIESFLQHMGWHRKIADALYYEYWRYEQQKTSLWWTRDEVMALPRKARAQFLQAFVAGKVGILLELDVSLGWVKHDLEHLKKLSESIDAGDGDSTSQLAEFKSLAAAASQVLDQQSWAFDHQRSPEGDRGQPTFTNFFYQCTNYHKQLAKTLQPAIDAALQKAKFNWKTELDQHIGELRNFIKTWDGEHADLDLANNAMLTNRRRLYAEMQALKKDLADGDFADEDLALANADAALEKMESLDRLLETYRAEAAECYRPATKPKPGSAKAFEHHFAG